MVNFVLKILWSVFVRQIIKFSGNFTNLAMLEIRVYVGKSKRNSTKEITSSGDSRPDVLYYAFLTDQMITFYKTFHILRCQKNVPNLGRNLALES